MPCYLLNTKVESQLPVSFCFHCCFPHRRVRKEINICTYSPTKSGKATRCIASDVSRKKMRKRIFFYETISTCPIAKTCFWWKNTAQHAIMKPMAGHWFHNGMLSCILSSETCFCNWTCRNSLIEKYPLSHFFSWNIWRYASCCFPTLGRTVSTNINFLPNSSVRKTAVEAEWYWQLTLNLSIKEVAGHGGDWAVL